MLRISLKLNKLFQSTLLQNFLVWFYRPPGGGAKIILRRFVEFYFCNVSISEQQTET